MLWVGLMLIALVVGFLFIARSQNKRDRQLAVAETLSCAELTDLQKTAVDAVGECSRTSRRRSPSS
jgi:hypothetical protein